MREFFKSDYNFRSEFHSDIARTTLRSSRRRRASTRTMGLSAREGEQVGVQGMVLSQARSEGIASP